MYDVNQVGYNGRLGETRNRYAETFAFSRKTYQLSNKANLRAVGRLGVCIGCQFSLKAAQPFTFYDFSNLNPNFSVPKPGLAFVELRPCPSFAVRPLIGSESEL